MKWVLKWIRGLFALQPIVDLIVRIVMGPPQDTPEYERASQAVKGETSLGLRMIARKVGLATLATFFAWAVLVGFEWANLSTARSERSINENALVLRLQDTLHRTVLVPGAKDGEVQREAFFPAQARATALNILLEIQRRNGVRPDFSRALLYETLLRNLDLSGAIYTKAWFGSVNCDNSDLSGSNLRIINARSAIFVDAELVESDLGKGDFSLCTFTRADLSGAKCIGADFSNAILHSTLVDGADFSNAEFAGAKVAGTNFSKAHGLTVEQARATENWRDARWPEDVAAKLSR